MADALALGASESNLMEVQVLSPAHCKFIFALGPSRQVVRQESAKLLYGGSIPP